MQRSLWAVILVFASAQACTTAGGCGSQQGAKIPGGFKRQYVQNDVVQMRISPSGFSYIESNLMGLVESALGKKITFTMPPEVIGSTFTLCPGGGCTANIDVEPGSLKITRSAPDDSGKSKIQIDAAVSIEVDNIYADGSDNDSCRIDFRYVNHYADACQANGNSFGGAIGTYCQSFCNANSPGNGRNVTFAVSVGVDPVLGYPTVHVDQATIPLQASNNCSAIEDIRAVQPNHVPPTCNGLPPTDLSSNAGACCDAGDTVCDAYYESVLNNSSGLCVLSELGSDLAAAFQPFIETAATFAINQQLSAKLTQPCETDADCEQGLTCGMVQTAGGFPDGCVDAGCLLPPIVASVCNSGGSAVPPLAGLEAEEDVATIAEAGGALPSGALFGTAGGLQFIAGVGGDLGNDSDADITARGDTPSDNERGLTIAGFMGMNSAQTDCAPPQARPLPVGHQALQMPDQVTLFDPSQKQTVTADYAAAMSLSTDALNQLAWGVYTNGDMCLTYSGTKNMQLNSQLLSLLVSSLGVLEDNQNEPAFINVFPEALPHFSAGAGELSYADDGTPQVKSPHLQIDVNKLNLEFYAFVEDRYVRLFTIKVDFSAGVFFDFDDKGNFLPVVSDLNQGLGQVTVANVDVLGEKVDALQKLLPALLSFALPEVTAALLKPFPLPLNKLVPGYTFEVVGLHGMSPIAGTDNYDFLSVFGAVSGASVIHDGPSGTAEFTLGKPRVEVPQGDLFEASTSPVLHVPTNDSTLEYSYRLDGSMWSPFANVKELSVSRAVLRVAGTHTLEVLARRVGDRRSLSAIQTLSFEVQPTTVAAEKSNTAPSARGCNAAGQEVAWLVSLALLIVKRRRREDVR